MNRRSVLLGVLVLPALSRVQSSQAQSLSDIASALKDPLIAALTSKLGINEKQAQGGMGAMLALAQEKLKSSDFNKITALVPTATKYMDTAKQLGAVTGPLKNMSGLNGAFTKLGMNADTAKKFVPTATDYIGSLGGESVQNMLLGALK